MRRPNRSIEVFDISLMAVVTKAMGAFLVLMLLLMPYYSSGPIGQQSAADLARQLEEARRQLADIRNNAGKFSEDPSELRKLLENVTKHLEDATRTMSLLKRDNDALNSQVARLEAQAKQLEAQVEQLRAQAGQLAAERSRLEDELDARMRPVLSGQLTNSDCLDVRYEFGVVEKSMKLTVGDPASESYLNYNWIFGDASVLTDDIILRNYEEAAKTGPGHGMRFNHSAFRASLVPGTWAIVLVSKSKTSSTQHGQEFRPLKKPASDCRVLLDLTYFFPRRTGSSAFVSLPTRELILSKDYAMFVYAVLTVSADDKLEFLDTTTEHANWVFDQLKLAKIEAASQPSSPQSTLTKEQAEDLRKRSDQLRKQMGGEPQQGK